MKELRANLLLLLTAMIWGAAFVAQSVSMDYIGPFTFLLARSVLGGVVLLPVIAVMNWGQKQQAAQEKKKHTLLLGGVCCGAVLFVASSLQQIGIQYTTAGKAGFITAMYMVLVPICRPVLWKASRKKGLGGCSRGTGGNVPSVPVSQRL